MWTAADIPCHTPRRGVRSRPYVTSAPRNSADFVVALASRHSFNGRNLSAWSLETHPAACRPWARFFPAGQTCLDLSAKVLSLPFFLPSLFLLSSHSKSFRIPGFCHSPVLLAYFLLLLSALRFKRTWRVMDAARPLAHIADTRMCDKQVCRLCAVFLLKPRVQFAHLFVGKGQIFSHLREQLSVGRLALVSATIDVFVDDPDPGFLPLDHYHLVAIIIKYNLLDLGGEKSFGEVFKGQSLTEVLMVSSWTESRRAVPRWQQILKCFVLTKLVQSNQEGCDTMINFTKLLSIKLNRPRKQRHVCISKVRSVCSLCHPAFITSDSTLMQLHLRHKYSWLLLISTVTFCCLGRLCFGSPTMDIFTPTLFCIFSYGRFNRREWAGARKAGGSWPWRYSPSAHTELFYVMI